MPEIYTSVDQLIGNTPLLELCGIEKKYNLKAKILAKLEFMNPGGSVKDRVAKSMLNHYEDTGIVNQNSVIIEPTSGNTGIGLSLIGAARGYRTIIVMPDNMSEERKLIMSAYGAELILTDGSKGMKGAIEKANELKEQLPDSVIAGQFTNPANPQAHYDTTGPEIYRDTDGNLDIFVAGVGTGGTITGTAKYLKEQNPDIKIIGVEPDTSAVLSGKEAGPHKLQGIGAGFVPEVLDTELIDEVMPVSAEDAYSAGRLMGSCDGILAGISSGAALHAAIELAKRSENADKTIVVLLPDTGDRYLSTELFK